MQEPLLTCLGEMENISSQTIQLSEPHFPYLERAREVLLYQTYDDLLQLHQSELPGTLTQVHTNNVFVISAENIYKNIST